MRALSPDGREWPDKFHALHLRSSSIDMWQLPLRRRRRFHIQACRGDTSGTLSPYNRRPQSVAILRPLPGWLAMDMFTPLTFVRRHCYVLRHHSDVDAVRIAWSFGQRHRSDRHRQRVDNNAVRLCKRRCRPSMFLVHVSPAIIRIIDRSSFWKPLGYCHRQRATMGHGHRRPLLALSAAILRRRCGTTSFPHSWVLRVEVGLHFDL